MFSNKNHIAIIIVCYFTNCIHTVLSQKSNSEKIQSIRENIIRYYGKSIASDVESVKNGNWFFERYLTEYNFKEREAEKAIIEAFDYFHKERFHELTDTYFPSEGFAVGGIYRFGRSKFGQPLLGAVMNHIRPFGLRLAKESIIKLTQKYCLYNIYKTLFNAKEKNFIAYVVFTNTTLENTEFSLFQKAMFLMNKYIPGAPLKIYVVGMNKLMEVSVKLLTNLLKPSLKNRIHFVDRLDQMEDLISLDEVPVHAGGRNTEYQRIPPGVRSGKCLPHLLTYISPKDWDIYRDINILAIQEGMRESNVTSSVDQYLRGCDEYYNRKRLVSQHTISL